MFHGGGVHHVLKTSLLHLFITLLLPENVGLSARVHFLTSRSNLNGGEYTCSRFTEEDGGKGGDGYTVVGGSA